MDYGVKKEIEPMLYSTNKNRSYKLVWDILYYTRLLKYIHRTQYKKIRSRLSMAATKKNLTYLCKQGYLKEVRSNIYCAKDRAVQILQEINYEKNLRLLPQEPVGNGDINEMNNTVIFLQAIKLTYFYTLLYPCFDYLKPDALLVLKNENSYKLTFLEIEAKKPNWEQYLETKKDSYLRLAKDVNFYKYWKDASVKLGLICPVPRSLTFNVNFICSIQKDFGKGFHFKSYVC